MTTASEQISAIDNVSPAVSGPEPERIDVAIIGGGISGLALAAWLARAGVSAVTLERADRAGGVMSSARQDGFLFEGGPNTILDKSSAFNDLVEWAGLSARAQRVPMRSLPRHIWFDGRLRPAPTGPGGALTTSLLTPFGKLRALGDFFILPHSPDEPLRDFVIRRFGREVYDRMFLPMVQGIGAGDPAQISVEAAFPALKRFEREYGGVLKGFITSMKAAAKAARSAGGTQAGSRATSIVSFPEGLGELPRAIAERLGPTLRLGVEVDSITPQRGGGALITGRERGEPRAWRAAHVVITAEAWTAAEWVRPWAPKLADALDATRYCPMVAVGLGVPADSMTPPPGFGFLAVRGQGLRVLGAILNSNFLPGRAPEGHRALTVMLGGELDPGALDMDDTDIMLTLKRDLGRALKWDGRTTVKRVGRWPRAIPQYGLDHFQLIDAILVAEAKNPGVHFLGNWRDGVSINDRVERGRELADRLAPKILTARAQA